MNGYDRYLEFQLGMASGFTTLLFRLIGTSDSENRRRLAQSFPEEVRAYETWARDGTDAVYARATEPGLVQRMKEVY
jgi:hypothetical protein